MVLKKQQRSANLCLIKIEQFTALMNILNSTQSSHIIITVADSLERQVSKRRQFINLESALDNSPKIADLGNGILAFISAKIQPPEELYAELNDLLKQLPKQCSILGLDLQLNYRCSVVEPIADDGFDAWLQRGHLSFVSTTSI